MYPSRCIGTLFAWAFTIALASANPLLTPVVISQEPAPSIYPQSQDGEPNRPNFSPEQLEQMLAPIALYPDSLLTQVLMACTYPLEIVEADRWARANRDMQGDEAAPMLENENWDPSVKSLVNFPDVLSMLSDRLEWTESLGDAFLGQQQDVMDTVQRLRARAHDAGNLTSTSHEVVDYGPDGNIIITEASPNFIYVPAYDPFLVYGNWPYPSFPPFRYWPHGFHGYLGGPSISWEFGVPYGFAWGYAWGHFDWGHHS